LERLPSEDIKFKYHPDDKEISALTAARKVEYDPVENWSQLIKEMRGQKP
jgi:hypothetical protein